MSKGTASSQPFNPFAAAASSTQAKADQRPSDDLLCLFDSSASSHTTSAASAFPPTSTGVPIDSQMAALQLDPTNPFAQNVFAQPPVMAAPVVSTG